MVNEIKSLVDRLNRYRDAYYNQNESLISDKEYDNLFDRLTELEEETGIILANSPTQTVGYKVVGKLQKVTHSHPLLSLGKTTDIGEFVEYFGVKPTVIMAKLDGLTCSLLYENGELIRAESRGNGVVGEDITHNAFVFSNIPKKIPFKGSLTVDGECIITKTDFEEIKKRENTEYKNPRNLASGSVRQLDSSIVAKRNIKFIAWKLHDLNGSENYKTYKERFEYLKTLGFDVVPYIYVKENVTQKVYSDVISTIQENCNKIEYPIDGIVGAFNDVAYGESLGMTGHHPKHSLAFKFYQEDNETTLIDIEWSTSRTGLVNPVAVFEPTEIDGTTVERATLNNVSIIKELELGIGDTITVIKANQIIPKITQNLTRSNTYQIPDVCPSCGSKLEIRNDNGREMLYCNNKKCPSIIHDKIANFASRDAINIIGISEERLRTLMDMGYIKDFASIYEIKNHRDEIAKVYGFGESSVDGLIQAIEDSKKCPFQNVIVAIGIPGIGKSAAKMIAKYCQDLNNGNPFKTFIDIAIGRKDWSVLPEIGSTTSNNINQYVIDNYDEIEPLVSILEIETPKVSVNDNKLNGKSFCITGKLIEFANRDALVADIESAGGTVVSSVTAKTDYLITNDKTSGSAKNKAAEKHGTTIITEKEYISLKN